MKVDVNLHVNESVIEVSVIVQGQGFNLQEKRVQNQFEKAVRLVYIRIKEAM
jgi:hypothetical protein